MSKRKLNKRQQWRIEKIQQEKAKRAQQKEQHIDQQRHAGDLSNARVGTVIAHFGTLVEVEDEQRTTSICHMRANLGALVTGDRVVFCDSTDEHGVIEAVHERRSILSRPNPYNEIKPVAANIDALVLVIAPEPEAFHNLIDRYLVAAENCSIEPLLLLNKTDLLNADNRQHFMDMLSGYEQLDYQTMLVCSHEPDSLTRLKTFLSTRTCVFVGQSGVGKSSLIHTLLPDEDIKIGALSNATKTSAIKKGRHTTTTARLYHFPSGGNLIDSPGIREFGLWHMSADEVLYGFRELRSRAGLCKFRNCKHEQEPGCALRSAIEQGDVSARRFESFKRIVATLGSI